MPTQPAGARAGRGGRPGGPVNTLPIRKPCRAARGARPLVGCAIQIASPSSRARRQEGEGWLESPRPVVREPVADNETLGGRQLRSLGGAWSRRRSSTGTDQSTGDILIGYGDQELLLRVEHDRAHLRTRRTALLGHVVTIEGMAAARRHRGGDLPILSAE